MGFLWRTAFQRLAFLWPQDFISSEGAVHVRAIVCDPRPRGLLSVARIRSFVQQVVTMGPIPARQKNTPYRITMIGPAWHVARPHASLVHAFDDLDEAVGFVC